MVHFTDQVPPQLAIYSSHEYTFLMNNSQQLISPDEKHQNDSMFPCYTACISLSTETTKLLLLYTAYKVNCGNMWEGKTWFESWRIYHLLVMRPGKGLFLKRKSDLFLQDAGMPWADRLVGEGDSGRSWWARWAIRRVHVLQNASRLL